MRLDSVNERINLMGEKKKIFYFLAPDQDRHIIDEIMAKSNSLKDMIREEKIEIDVDYQESFGNKNAVYICKDFHVGGEQDRQRLVQRFLKEASAEPKVKLLVSSHDLFIPDGFANEILLIKVGFLDSEDIENEFGEKIEKLLGKENAEKNLAKLRGLSRGQIEEIMGSADVKATQMGRQADFKKKVKEVRRDIADKEGGLQIIDVEPGGDEPKGLERYTSWLEEHVEAFLNPEEAKANGEGEAVKGAALYGLPGTGKTFMALLAAKMLSGKDSEPLTLVDLDLTEIDSSNYGESQKRLKRYLERVEAMAPCVLLIDEIERSFKSDGKTHEVKEAQIGILLKWLQNRKAQVFTFITSNDVENVPPALMRQGRIDEKFFVFLPTAEELGKIINQKLKRRKEEMTKVKEDVYGIDEFIEKKRAGVLLDSVALYAEKNNRIAKFFTGANVEKGIISNALNKKNFDTKNNKKWTLNEAFKTKHSEALKECPLETDIEKALYVTAIECVSQGESDMRNIIDTWFKGKEKNYKSAGEKDLFPFARYRADAKSKEEIFGKTGNESWRPAEMSKYDSYMFDYISEKIFEEQKRRNRR